MHFRRAAVCTLTVLPWIGYGLLTLLVWAAVRQVGHWPHIKGPDPRNVALFFQGDNAGRILWLSVMLLLPACLVAGVMLFASFVESLWGILSPRGRTKPPLMLGRLAPVILFTIGLDLFIRESGTMMYWLLD
jgi:hypothetical protein